jgi:WD40 repeat protein
VALSDGSVLVLARENNAFRPFLSTSFDQPMSLTFLPKSKRLAILSGYGTLKVVAIPLGDFVLPLRDQVNHIAFAPDSQSLAIAKTAGRIATYDFCTDSLAEIPGAGNAGGAVAFSPNGTLLAGASAKRVYIHRVPSWEVLRTILSYNAYVIAILPDT